MTSTLSGSSAISILRRRPPRLSAVTVAAARAPCRCSPSPGRTSRQRFVRGSQTGRTCYAHTYRPALPQVRQAGRGSPWPRPHGAPSLPRCYRNEKCVVFPEGALTDFGFQKRGVRWVRAPAHLRALLCAQGQDEGGAIVFFYLRRLRCAGPQSRCRRLKKQTTLKWGVVTSGPRFRAARRYLAAISKCLAQSTKSYTDVPATNSSQIPQQD